MKINGIEVQDADEKLILKITKQDIRKGATKDSSSCAAANALCRQEHYDAARVHFSRAYVKRGRKWLRFQVPDALRSEIIAFDRGGEFEPGEYVLSPVTPNLRLDAPRIRKDDTRVGKHVSTGKLPKRKRPYHVATGVRARMMADWE